MPADQCRESDTQPRADRHGCLRIKGSTAHWLAAAFVLYGLVATAFLAINMPPFQNPDEGAHFRRAEQVANGGVIGYRFSGPLADGSMFSWAGGLGDPAMTPAAGPFTALIAHLDTRATRAMWAPKIHWSKIRTLQEFGGSALNPPWFYVPAAIGIWVGRASRMTVVQTLMTSRILTGVTAVTVAAVAIACAGGAAVWLFAILTLPMSLAVLAAASEEALVLACSAVAGMLVVRLLRWPGDRDGKLLAWLTIILVLVGTARVPYGALALLPLGLMKLPLRSRVLAAAAVAACVFAWSALASAVAVVNLGAFQGTNPTAQAARLLTNPLLFVSLLWDTIALNWEIYLDEFVGRLGWLDTVLPPDYHRIARVMLVVAAVAAMLGLRGNRISIGSGVLVGAGVLLSAAGIFAVLYLTWTVPGGAIVEGVQGRYFLPLAVAGAALLPALGNTRLARLHNPLVLLVAAFPLISLAVLMRAVVVRYYLG